MYVNVCVCVCVYVSIEKELTRPLGGASVLCGLATFKAWSDTPTGVLPTHTVPGGTAAAACVVVVVVVCVCVCV